MKWKQGIHVLTIKCMTKMDGTDSWGITSNIDSLVQRIHSTIYDRYDYFYDAQ